MQESLTSDLSIHLQLTAGAIAGFDPIMKMSKRRTKKRKKMESAGKQWDHRRRDPTYIDGRSKQARNLIKRLTKKKKNRQKKHYSNTEEQTIISLVVLVVTTLVKRTSSLHRNVR